MKLEKQVVNLELSKKLKELGVKQESYFAYVNTKQKGEIHLLTTLSHYVGEENFISAYTVAELGVMLDKAGADNFIKAYGEVFNFKRTQMVGLLGVIDLMRTPDMGAKMLIYLIENKL